MHARQFKFSLGISGGCIRVVLGQIEETPLQSHCVATPTPLPRFSRQAVKNQSQVEPFQTLLQTEEFLMRSLCPVRQAAALTQYGASTSRDDILGGVFSVLLGGEGQAPVGPLGAAEVGLDAGQ